MDKSDQDASEFLFFLLDKLDLEMKIPYTFDTGKRKPLNYLNIIKHEIEHEWLSYLKENGYSVIKDLFYNSIVSISQCLDCGYEYV
jgi:ubiquitin C-terminal hydrolase